MVKARQTMSEEQRRLKKRMLEMGVRQIHVADFIGITRQDVSNVVNGRSDKPKYVEKVYNFLGLDMPQKDTE